MISDVLFDAVEEIRRYQKDYSEVYEDIRPMIDEVVLKMKGLQAYLDKPPHQPTQ